MEKGEWNIGQKRFIMQLFYSSVSCIGIVALLILEHIARKSDTMAVAHKRFFCLSIWVTIIVMVSEIVTVFLEGAAASYRIPHIMGNVLGFALSPLIPLLIGCAIGEFHKNSLILFGILPTLNLILTVLSARFPIIFWVDAKNMYMRGNAFGVYVLAYSVAFVYLLVQTLLLTKCYQNSNRSIPLVLFFFVGFCAMGQVIVPWLHISWLCVSFAIALYYMYYCDLVHQIDALTGLLNRRTYEYNLRKIESSDKAAIILFDVDDFKNANDMYGHPFGDYCLTAVSSCIKKAFFKIGLCFRIGGDEFCVIAKKANRAAVERAYSRFLQEIELMRKAEARLPMVSIGYSFTGDKSESIMDAVFEADQNMYRFKQQRKKTVKF